VKNIVVGNYKLGLGLNNLKPGTYLEVILYHKNYEIAGTADKIEVFEDNSINITDYKTKKSIDKNSLQIYDPKTYQRVPKMMYSPVAHLEDCNWNHYCLQLSMYAFFLETCGYTVRELILEHAIFENNLVVDIVRHEVPYLRKEVEDICNHYTHEKILKDFLWSF
jgi:hypothetical protein